MLNFVLGHGTPPSRRPPPAGITLPGRGGLTPICLRRRLPLAYTVGLPVERACPAACAGRFGTPCGGFVMGETVNRRDFLGHTSGAAAALGLGSLAGGLPAFQARAAGSAGPNGDIRVACIGVHGKGQTTSPGCGLSGGAGRGPVRHRPVGAREPGPPPWRSRPATKSNAIERLSQAGGRPEHRRREHRHLQPHAHADRHRGHGRPAKTCTWRSPARTTSGKAGNWWPPPPSTAAWCSTAPRAAARRPSARRCDKLREGVIGDVYMARGLCFKWRDTIGHTHD